MSVLIIRAFILMGPVFIHLNPNKMRFLLFLLYPLVSYSQPTRTDTYHVKTVHTITVKSPTVTNWKVDTITYHVPFEIKYNAQQVSIDGLGTYKVAQYERRCDGECDFYKFTNNWTMMVTEVYAIFESPIVNKKGSTIVFDLD